MLYSCSSARNELAPTPTSTWSSPVCEDGKTKQRIIQNLGRKEVVEARGDM